MEKAESNQKDVDDFLPDSVAIRRCHEYNKEALKAAIEKCVGLIGGFRELIGNAKKILLKPNLLSASKPELAVTTHPVFIESVIEIIKKATPAGISITIADSPGVSTPHTKENLEKLYRQCGLSYLGNIERVNLNLDPGYMEVSFKEGLVIKTLEVISPVLDADLIINLPKFKTHSLTRITGAVKNMFGIIHGKTKTILHTKFIDIEKFNNMLLDIYLYKKPQLNIMDGIIGMEGDGPGASGTPRNTGLVLASSNGLALDNIMTHIMGFGTEKIPLIRCAEQRGMPGHRIENIKVLGGDLKNFIIKDYRLPGNSSLDRISGNWFLKTYALPFIRNNLSVSPYQDIKKCNMCRACIEICPEKAIKEQGGRLVFDYKKCIRCYCCSEMCPEGAIDLNHSFIGNLFFGRKNIK